MAPTVAAAAVVPVTAWPGEEGEHRCARAATPKTPPARAPQGTAMSDADTEGSGSVSWRNISITSSESDGPRIVIQTTSDDEDDDVTALSTTFHHLPELDSVTTTDMGSDYTSEGGESKAFERSPVTVTAELEAALVKQLEDYLSDAGLAKDLFLLKHVKRHRDGFVSLKLLSGYKKVKQLSRDWRVLAAALRASKTLDVNEEGTKVRRRTPLPATLLYDVPSSRALAAVNVPVSQATIAALADLFGAFGTVASLQVIRPKAGGGIPSELQFLATRIPEVASTICAVVEYEDVWGAARALHQLNNPPVTLHVLRRSRRPTPDSSRASPTPTPTPKSRTGYKNGIPPEELRQRLKGTRSRQHQNQAESSASEGEENSAGWLSWRRSPNQLTPQNRPRLYHHHHHHHLFARKTASSPASPATHRRQYTQQQQQQAAVTRIPRGPDGTRGFSKVRS